MDGTTKVTMERVQKDINSAIDEIAKQCPEMANHLRKHIIFNVQSGTVCYTGDIKWNLTPPPDAEGSRDGVSKKNNIDMARGKLERARHQVYVDFNNCHSRQIERDIEWIRESLKKGEFTLDEVGTSNEELKEIDERAFSLREGN